MQAFTAVLEKGDRSLGWTVARVPFDPSKVWSRMCRLRVSGEISGPRGVYAFRSSLFPHADGYGFFVLVNRAMQHETGLTLGGKAAFRLEPDLAPRPAELPDELDPLLDEAEGLRAWYANLSEYTRREIGKWVEGVKGEEARRRRAEVMAERLLSTMEAEVELTPLIERAFRARPRARAGWHELSAAQRRAELMAVFYYQSPEAKEKRLAKLCDLAEKRAGNGRSIRKIGRENKIEAG